MDQLGSALSPDALAAQDQLEDVPAYLRNELMFPYLSGLSYACRLYVEGGWPAVDAAYDDLPQTTAEILFPEAAGDKPENPRDPASPGGGWTQARRTRSAPRRCCGCSRPRVATRRPASRTPRTRCAGGRVASSRCTRTATVRRWPSGWSTATTAERSAPPCREWYGAAFDATSEENGGVTVMAGGDQVGALRLRGPRRAPRDRSRRGDGGGPQPSSGGGTVRPHHRTVGAGGAGHDAAAGRDRHRGHDHRVVQGRSATRSPSTTCCSRCRPRRSTPRCPSAVAGFLRAVHVAEGDTVPIGTPLAVITATADEPIDEPGGCAAPQPPRRGRRRPRHDRSPRTDRPAGRHGARRAGRGPSTDGFLSPVVRRAARRARPRARRRRRHGRDGRITRDRRAGRRRATDRPSRPPPAAAAGRLRPTARRGPTAPGRTTRSSSSRGPAGHRRAHGALAGHERPTRSWSPRSTTTASTRCAGAAGLSYLPFVARAAIDACGEFPHLNASVGDDWLIVHRRIHLGVAVDVDYEALVVPVVHDAGGLRLGALAERSPTWPTRPAAKRLTGDDLTGGTFTLTNVGSYGTVVDRADHQPAPGGHPVDRRRRACGPVGGAQRGGRVGRRRAPGRQPEPQLRPPGRRRGLRRGVPGPGPRAPRDPGLGSRRSDGRHGAPSRRPTSSAASRSTS